MSDGARAIPVLGSTPLDAVNRIQHVLDGGFTPTAIAGLDGEVQQRTGRGSHQILLEGTLFGDGAADALKTLQEAAATGAELAFSADISTALDLQNVVIEGFRATELAGRPGTWSYELALAESPPLPAPAQVASFGGLGDFGLGDLGVDLGVLDDIAGAAADVAGAVQTALSVVDQLSALSALGSLGGLGGMFEPLGRQASGIGSAGDGLAGAARSAQEQLA